MTRIVVVAASTFGAQCAELARVTPGVEIAGIVTAPRRFAISYSEQLVTNVLHADLESLAANWGVPSVVMTGPARDEALIAKLASWRPDLFLVVGWYHIVPRAWRDLAPAYGMHASLLPAYRGGAPLVWAMINGEREAGISFFQLDDGIDTGGIVGQRAVPILLNDTIASLYARVEIAGRAVLEATLPGLIDGSCTPRPQAPGSGSVVPQRAPSDGVIDWSRPSLDVYNFIRAQTRPYPGAFTFLGDERVQVWEAKLYDAPAEAGAGAGDIIGHISQGPLRGVLVNVGERDHALLITEASNAQGTAIDLRDGGEAWLKAIGRRRFGAPA